MSEPADQATEEKIGIIAEPTPNPASFKFTVDRPLLPGHSVHFGSREEAQSSELARLLFELEDVSGVFVSENFVTVTKRGLGDWRPFARSIGPVIRTAVRSGKTLISEETLHKAQGTTEVEKKILQVLEEVRPNLQADGGDVVFAGFHEGMVTVSMKGSCSGCPSSTMTVRMVLESRLKQEIPEVKGLLQI